MNRKTIITVLKYGASIAILAWLYYKNKGEFDSFFESEKNYVWLGLAAITITFAFFISYMRWHALANAIDLKLSVSDAAKLGFIGSFFNVVAFGVVGGDSLRAFYATRHSPDRIPEAILSVFIDRFIGLMVMFGFAASAWYLNSILGNSADVETPTGLAEQAADRETRAAIGYVCNAAGAFCLIGFIGLGTFLVFPGMRNFALFQWFQKIPKIGPLIERGLEAAALYSKNKIVIVIAMACSLCTNLLFAFTIYLVASALSPDRPTLPQHFVIAPISMVANSVPLPGGVGGMEVALSKLYASYGAPNGFIVALGYRVCILMVSLLGWFVWLRYGKSVEVEDQMEK